MKLTSKGRYAVTAILDIAINADGKPVTLSDISERQHISLSYLEQLFAKLRRHGLVKSVRGPGGGYRLGHPAGDISIGMVIAAVNENINVTKCLGKELPWRNWLINSAKSLLGKFIRILKIY